MPKLSIASKVRVPMKFRLQDGPAVKTFSFALECERLETDDWQKRIKNDEGVTTNEKIKETLVAITTGWPGQTLVLDDDTNEPAACDKAGLECMFQVPGVLDVAVASYMKESAATVKN